jgi:hypothetical protein
VKPVTALSEAFNFHNVDLRRYLAYGQLGLGWQRPTSGRWAPFTKVAYFRSVDSESQLDYFYENALGQEIVVGWPERYDPPADVLNFGGGVDYSHKFAG